MLGEDAGALSRRARELIRQFDRQNQNSREALVPELVALYDELSSDTQLEPRRRRRLVKLVERRLQRMETTLVRRLKETEPSDLREPSKTRPIQSKRRGSHAPSSIKAKGNPTAVLAQRAAGGQRAGAAGAGAAPGQAAGTQAQALVDLIRTTIAPKTWDVNGGKGTIYYYQPVQALVVRQTP